MAARESHFEFRNFHDVDDDEDNIGNLESSYVEDEYGYVEPNEPKASQVLIAQLPSRHLDTLLTDESDKADDSRYTIHRKDSHYRTLQLKNATLNSRHKVIDADKIYEILNSDPNLNEEDKMKTLREIHQSLSIKRQVKEKLDAERRKKIASKAIGSFVRFKLSICMALQILLYEIKSLFYFFEPWHSSIKAIQGQFGSCVASYFIFLRWLLYLNVCNLFLTFCFVIIPELINTDKAPSYLGNKTESFTIDNLLTGSGWLIDSHLYFGAYSSQVIQPVSGVPYNMPLAYLCTIGANMLINLVAVSISITASYQKNYVDTAGEIKNVFCNKIFSAWDYAIETENGALLQKRAFCNDIKELLYTRRLSEKRMTLSQSILQKCSLICVSLFAVAVVVSVGYLTYYLLQTKAVQVDIPILKNMTFAITVSLISSVFFYLLKFSTVFEAYISKKIRLYLTMIRVVILRIVMLGIVTYFWMVIYKPPRDKKVCYEAELGSEFYRLILVHFLVALIIFTLIAEFVRKLFHVYVNSRISLKEFDVAYNTLDLIYFQTLAWLAMFCVPLSSLIIIVILILLFYIKMISMSYNCRPPKRSWSVNEMQTFYLILTFLMFFFAAITIGYTIFALESSFCGPFKDYKSAGAAIQAVFFHEGMNQVTKDTISYLTSPGVLFAVFCALCLFVHYMRAQANAHISVIKKIRETLILASKDKVFLLKLFDEAFSAHLRNKISSDSNKLSRNRDGKLKESKDSFHENSSSDTHQEIVINEGYKDYAHNSHQSSHPVKIRPGYSPANVPANKLPHSDINIEYSKKASPSHHIRKGEQYPLHESGFRNILPGQTLHLD